MAVRSCLAYESEGYRIWPLEVYGRFKFQLGPCHRMMMIWWRRADCLPSDDHLAKEDFPRDVQRFALSLLCDQQNVISGLFIWIHYFTAERTRHHPL